MNTFWRAAVMAAALCGGATACLAQKAPQITIIVGTSTGGLYDLTARLWSRHMGRFLPGEPLIVVQNMPGAGSLTATNNLYNLAPKDGTTLGVINASGVLQALFGDPAAKFDPRQFAWIGGRSQETAVCAFWHTSKPNTFEDLKKFETNVGSSGPGASSYTHLLMINALLGTKMRNISGYPGGSEMSIALERGEIDGECGWSWGSLKTRTGHWLREKKLKLLLQAALKKNPEIDAPLALDLAPDKESRDVMELVLTGTLLAWPLIAPPGLPAEKVAQLRKAFDAMMKDPEMLKDAEKIGLEIDPVGGEEMQQIVRSLYELSPAVIEKAKGIILK